MRRMNQISQDEMESREKTIVKTGFVGIVTNVVLAAFKVTIGLLSNSVAIIMDAVNNFSDAGSSLITIIGAKLAGKEPDKKHPFGYGRIEYLSAMVISMIVLYAGVTSFTESVKKIANPVIPEYAPVSLFIIGVAVIVKIVLGRYVKSVGKRVNSSSLVNSGEDATLDSVISASTLVAALIFMFSGLSLEPWLGAIISVIIIKSGLGMLRETVSQILGERNDPDLTKNIKETVKSFEGVQGAYDLVLNNYGPDSWNGSIHIEVPDTYSADQLDRLIRRIQEAVYTKYQVVLTAIGVYSINTRDEDIVKAYDNVKEMVLEHKHVLQMHGFFLDKENMTIRFDIVVSFNAKDRRAVYNEVLADVQKAYPDYQLQVAMDADFSEK
ncbi:MAG: cation diffusion facilitator family transporter [Lachnospiraceae bacterium]|nr:cation diffusion facilitator family transporter [Lachnospiraceae bacterium]